MAEIPKAIPTRYSGCLFRSRLEARWAVFFDYINLRWMYEREGFDLGELGWYLPDFWFTDLRCWGEVKPKRFTEIEFRKARALPDPCILFDDQPADRFWFVAGLVCSWENYRINNHEAVNTHGNQDNFSYCHLEFSALHKRLWLSLGESLEDYGLGLTGQAVEAARSVRFESGPPPGLEPFNLSPREMLDLHLQERRVKP